MPKLEIVEIENSYLNFFTPAMIIAVGLFLEHIFFKTFFLFFFTWFLQFFRIGIDIFVLEAFFAIMTGILLSLITYYIFIPRFKVIDAEYHPPQPKGLIYIFPVFCIIILFRIIAIFTYELGGDTVPYSVLPWYLKSFDQLRDQTFFFLFLINQFIIIPISLELLCRRTVIPALEDRGLSPLNSVILSSFGLT